MGRDRVNAMVCQVCGHKNLAGTLVCDNCGSLLSKEVRTGTRNLADELPEFRENPVFTTSGTGYFENNMELRINIEGQPTEIKVYPNQKDLLLGRRDATSRVIPDIDLEDYNGYRMGVSRKHAMISLRNKELTVQDYGSANGTYLNGVKLPAHRSHKLHDGDEIRLGNLTMRVYFLIH